MQAILQKKSSKFTSLFMGDSTAYAYYLQSVDLRIKGEWKNAGDRLMRCADQYCSLRMFSEAAAIFSEAAECFYKVDKDEAQIAWAAAIKIFCDLNMYEVSGRIEKRIADIHFHFKHWEDAALHYRKAANFMLSEADQSDHCLEKSAEALIYNGDSYQSQLMYENIALSCAAANLRFFHSNEKLLMAVLCLFGAPVAGLPRLEETKRGRPSSPEAGASAQTLTPTEVLTTYEHQYEVKYEEVAHKISEYDTLSATWRASKERLFVRNVLACRTEERYDDLIDHLYHWNNIKPLSDVALKLLKVAADETRDMLGRRTEIAKAEAEARAAKDKAKSKSKKLIP